jgi:hypothetical protein
MYKLIWTSILIKKTIKLIENQILNAEVSESSEENFYLEKGNHRATYTELLSYL